MHRIMSKISSAVNHLLKDIELLFPDDHLYTGEDINRIDNELRPKDLQVYMNPETDILEPGQESPCMRGNIIILGTYSAMSSPGVVSLCLDHLKDFFYSLVKRSLLAGYNISKKELKPIAKLVVYKTYWHELFHFDCDVLRHLFGGHIDPNIEEALAVARAWARITAEKDYKFWEIKKLQLFEFIVIEAFKYTSAGYRDWVDYSDENDFQHALLRYINPPSSSFLGSNGVQLQKLIFALLTQDNGKEGEGFIIKYIPSLS